MLGASVAVVPGLQSTGSAHQLVAPSHVGSGIEPSFLH